ncbi:innexin shaking-B isoform X4 [Chelonus insularis]|uniref:innexin shaking-B isoform X4 n=1 Tax=Chelonus insularis TaxID=460826 RepID=UPI001589BC7F|nr:innexin shaking-B isoform X4 [Chelonus insularis]
MKSIREISISSSSGTTSSSTSSKSTIVHIEKSREGGRTSRKTKRSRHRIFSESKRGRHEERIMDALGALYVLFHVSRVKSEGILLRLHVLTAALMLTFSIIVSTKQTVGNPIDCIHTRDIPVEAFNTYCWIHSTYFVTGAMLGVTGVNVAFPGVATSNFLSIRQFRIEHNQTRHRYGDGQSMIKQVKYYQWVAFILIFQAILFYTPRWLWKGWEGGKIHALMMDLDIGLCSEVEKKQKKKMLLDYLWENLRYHNWWAYRYYLCEVLALVNVIDVPDEPIF